MAKTQIKKSRIYETYMVLDSAVTPEQQAAILAKLKRAVEDAGGTWVLDASRGKKKLSYLIKKRNEALHVIVYTEGPGKLPKEIAQILKFETQVLRAQTVVVEKVPDPQAEAAQAEVSASAPEPSDPAYQEERDGELQ